MTVGYRIDPHSPDSHVSLVAYRGSGADTDMHALLISAQTESSALLRLWVHDGNEWSAKSDAISVDKLPLVGEVRLTADAWNIECSINGERVASFPKELFPWETAALGVRWLRATIYPSG